MTPRERAVLATESAMTKRDIVAALSASEPQTPQDLAADLGRRGWPINGRPIAEWEWWEA